MDEHLEHLKYLETERLVLRRFTGSDVHLLHDLDSDPEVMRFITGGKPTSMQEVREEVIPAILRGYERSEGFGIFAAIEEESGEFIGWFEFVSPEQSPPDEVELGYRLRRSAWSKGYATEGSLALIRQGFEKLGVRRVFAQTMIVNAASRRVMEKCGLKFVRTFFADWPYSIEGDEHGDVEYVLEVEDWIGVRT